MKQSRIVVLAVACLCVALTTLADVKRLSQAVASDAASETFGSMLNEQVLTATLADLVAEPKRHLGQEWLIQARISKVCQMKGCFFIATEGEHALRVSFLDYSFFIPTDSADKVVTLNAELVEQVLSSGEAAHFNKDIGGGDAIAPGTHYELVASAVRIRR